MHHKFNLGQLVRANGTRFHDRTNGVYEVVRLMPESNGEFGYRIKDVSNSSERAVGESEIQAANGKSQFAS